MIDPLIEACQQHIVANKATLWGQFSVATPEDQRSAALWLAAQVQAVAVLLAKDSETGSIDLR